jgi:hypothetical protein
VKVAGWPAKTVKLSGVWSIEGGADGGVGVGVTAGLGVGVGAGDGVGVGDPVGVGVTEGDGVGLGPLPLTVSVTTLEFILPPPLITWTK